MGDRTDPMQVSDGACDDPPVGVLMLDTDFPRPPGDVGNAVTWPFPVLYEVVEGAHADHVVRDAASGLLQRFRVAARDLVARGAALITTSCGFLALHQQQLAAAVDVPVATSAMLQVPWLDPLLPPGRRAGIVTADAASLTAAHLRSVGAAPDTPVAGLAPDDYLYRTIVLGQGGSLDAQRACTEVVAAARGLVDSHPEVGAIVLECTNMPPYAPAVQAATGLPVFDICTLVRWLHAAHARQAFTS